MGGLEDIRNENVDLVRTPFPLFTPFPVVLFLGMMRASFSLYGGLFVD
jgi:hypothetical protein